LGDLKHFSDLIYGPIIAVRIVQSSNYVFRGRQPLNVNRG